MFPEGGNYGHGEAVDVVKTLKRLRNTMSDEKIEHLKSLRPAGYGSLTEIKESLSGAIKPYGRS